MSNQVNFRKFYDSEEELSDEEEEQPVTTERHKSSKGNLYEENFTKYINLLKQVGDKMNNREKQIFDEKVWHVTHPLIHITQINYQKNQGIYDIIDMEAKNDPNTVIYKKILSMFAFLDTEIEKITQIFQLNIYDSLVMYGQGATEQDCMELMTSRVMSIYKKCYDLVKKLMSYVENLILQLHSIINKKNAIYKAKFKGLDYSLGFNLIGRALKAIYGLDCIVKGNPNILKHWEAYGRMIKLAKNEPQKFNTTIILLKKTEKMMRRLQNTILSTKCMQNILEIEYDQIFDKEKNPSGRIKGNKELKEYMEKYFESRIRNVEDDDQTKLFELMCTYSLYRKLFPSQQLKNTWKNLWTIQKIIPIIEVHSYVCLYVAQFLENMCPLSKKIKSFESKDHKQFLAQYIARMEDIASQEIIKIYTRFCVWLSRMQSVATSNSRMQGLDIHKDRNLKMLHERLSNRIILLCEGLNTIFKLKRLLYLCFILPINEQKSISQMFLGKLLLGLETLKAISYMIRKKTEAFDIMVLSKSISRDITDVLKPVYKRVKDEDNSHKHSDKLNILEQIIKILQSSMSQLKITLIKYALFLLSGWVLKEQEFQSIQTLLKRMELICYSQVLLQKYENCSYLYLCADMFPDIFQYKSEHLNSCKRLQFLFDAFEDAAGLIKNCPHLKQQDNLFLNYKNNLIKSFEDHYLAPLNSKVGDFLRIMTHSMLIDKLEGIHPFSSDNTEIMKLVSFQKIRIFDSVIDVNLQISKVLNAQFYNLNVLNMYDMETYQQMRSLAGHILGLRLHDVFLPNQTIQQGKFDILKLIRNIPSFIEHYKYNMLTQRFLQISNESKIINCIGIQQFSDSIRTHGFGILATTVNAFYKYLVIKIQAFSKFLFAQVIKTPLDRERKWLKQFSNGKDYPGYYPYERAQHLYKELKKAGKFENDANYLDKLRQIITVVGNSLGFVRLIRSASLNSYSKSIQFLPKKFDQITQSMKQLAEKAALSSTSVGLCTELDLILKSLSDNFSDRINYLSLMVKSFAKITSKQNKHLKLFYIIVPTLIINYIQNLAKGNQQINKKLSTKAFLYDDGFTLGLSYFLYLLNQDEHYKSMHWQIALERYFTNQKNSSKKIVESSSHSTKYIEDSNMQRELLLNKLQTMERDSKLLIYNMISANVLFKGKFEQSNAPKSPPTEEKQSI